MTVNHPLFKEITLTAEFYPAEKGTDEKNYSMGDPSYPAAWRVNSVVYKNQDVSDFIANFCDYLFSEFSEDLLTAYPNGLKED